ncbi:hypothetical protein SETIT_6G229400v2 [Setaria italica]|uniref:Uncharacterized protein n=1 Tax=Setaria italica TaxID=4555 RepID=A0A368RPJ5_SETIT|nr:hypothetical protein SETIT_6G229400v2 [Setaria italica]
MSFSSSTIRLGNASGWKVKRRSSTWNDFAPRRKLTRFGSFPRTWSAGFSERRSSHPNSHANLASHVPALAKIPGNVDDGCLPKITTGSPHCDHSKILAR